MSRGTVANIGDHVRHPPGFDPVKEMMMLHTRQAISKLSSSSHGLSVFWKTLTILSL